MSVFDFRGKKFFTDRMKRDFELKKALFGFKCRYLCAIVRKTGIRLPFRLIVMAYGALRKKRRGR